MPCALSPQPTRHPRQELSPPDTPLAAGTRFGIEVIAWIAGPWAVAQLTGSSVATVLVAVVLVAAPAVFSTPGDKNLVVVPTPGPIRIAIELALVLVAVAASAIVWPFWARIPIAVLALVMLVSNGPRMRALGRG